VAALILQQRMKGHALSFTPISKTIKEDNHGPPTDGVRRPDEP
jgi:hypothetical protein